MSSRQNLFAGATCFLFFLLFYGITSRGKLQASDEAAVFASGISLATTGHLAIDNFGWLQEKVNIGSVGPDGRLYTKYFPGNVFAVALIYKLTARPNARPANRWRSKRTNLRSRFLHPSSAAHGLL